MAEVDVPLAELSTARQKIVELINQSMTSEERSFLLSFKNRQPVWTLLGLQGVEQLPAVRWKLQNLAKMPVEKHADALAKLRDVLGV